MALLMAQRSRLLKQQRHVDMIVPLKSNMLSYKEAVNWLSFKGTGSRILHGTTSISPLSKALITYGLSVRCPLMPV